MVVDAQSGYHLEPESSGVVNMGYNGVILDKRCSKKLELIQLVVQVKGAKEKHLEI